MSVRVGLYVRVSTDEQRDNGYSIDNQLRLLEEHCKKHDYSIVDVYNDAGHSGKDLVRPNMQRLIKDIRNNKIDKLLALKVDRLTRNGYDGYWLLNYCEENEVKIELILEPYDVSTANGEMIFGMNLIFGQRERKEIGARTKRGLEEMALQKKHPAKSPYGYKRLEDGHLEVDPVERDIVRKIFDLCASGMSSRAIAKVMKEENRYLKNGKWSDSRVYKILENPIYTGTFYFGRYKRKKEDVLVVKDYCEPIIDNKLYKATRIVLEKNKHANYGSHIHLFASLVRCPECNKIMSSTLSYKYKRDKSSKTDYYFLTCRNNDCKSKGLHYNAEKLEKKLVRMLNYLSSYMLDDVRRVGIPNNEKVTEIENVDKAIKQLELQEKKLIDLYVSSNLNVEIINQKNDMVKKELEKLREKQKKLTTDEVVEFNIELLKKLDLKLEEQLLIVPDLSLPKLWEALNKQAQKEVIHKYISSIEITRDKNYDVDIKNIKFNKEYFENDMKYIAMALLDLVNEDIKGIIQGEPISFNNIFEMTKDKILISCNQYLSHEYAPEIEKQYFELLKKHFFKDGIIECPLIIDGVYIDELFLIPMTEELKNAYQNI